jgi:hypothetical protein
MQNSDHLAVPRRTWELEQIEIHNLRQLIGVVQINCQLAERRTLTYEDAARRNLAAIQNQQMRQYEAFIKMFAEPLGESAGAGPLARGSHARLREVVVAGLDPSGSNTSTG